MRVWYLVSAGGRRGQEGQARLGANMLRWTVQTGGDGWPTSCCTKLVKLTLVGVAVSNNYLSVWLLIHTLFITLQTEVHGVR